MGGPNPIPDELMMDWEASDLGPTVCCICKKDCFKPDSLSTSLLSDSSMLRSSNILPVIASCGHVFHQNCHQMKCPIDGCDILPLPTILSPEKKSSLAGSFSFTLRTGFPSRFATIDDFILQFMLAHYNMSGPFAPKVVSANIITNMELQSKFEEKKKRLELLGFGESLLLYHGTPLANVDSICSNNFNLDRVANGRSLGDGVYFSERWVGS